MFAVPGWKLPSTGPVLEQTKPSKNKTQTDKKARAQQYAEKRKRKSEQPHLDHEKSALSEGRRAQDEPQTINHAKRRKVHDPTNHKYEEDRRKTPKNIEFGAQMAQTDNVLPRKKFAPSRDNIVSNKQDNAPFARPQAERSLTSATPTALSSIPPAPSAPANTLTPLQAKMRSKLTSARFRHLNETLYTTSSTDALQLFTSSPDLFAEYHTGFSQQVKESWPHNPVDSYIIKLKERGSLTQPRAGLIPLPRRKTGSCTIADLGCGDAPLARALHTVSKKLSLRFHNYDLHEINSFVTKADISNVPLRDGEADIAVFCLSLMGTNWISFVEEAWRILRGDGKGEVWVAEVKSRFGRVTRGRVVENSVGKKRKKQSRREDELDGDDQPLVEDARTADQTNDETDISAFVKVFQRRGFVLQNDSVNKANKMFVSMVFVKSGVPVAGKHKGMKWNGKEYQQMDEQRQPNARFSKGPRGHEIDEDLDPELEAKTLKPCVYKTR